MVTSVSILGATGSIGSSALDLIRRDRGRYRVVALAAHRDVGKLAALAREFSAEIASVADESCFGVLKDALAGSGTRATAGTRGMLEAAQAPSRILIAAITGTAGLEPSYAALQTGRRVALANKESLVTAGALFMRQAAETGAVVLPVDSEHNAVFQALACGKPESVAKVTLTASGGPFRTMSRERMRSVTPDEAVRHPNWSMGAKISIDSATLMNKGLELIEAHHLFGIAPERLDVLVHPQSIVHALVAFHDGAVIAQLAPPDMRIPIGFCLNWPERGAWAAPVLDLAAAGTLTFEAPDLARFPALRLAKESLAAGGAAPTVLNAANEVATEAFQARALPFTGISELVEAVLDRAAKEGLLAAPATVNEALAIDHMARSLGRALLPQFAAKAS